MFNALKNLSKGVLALIILLICLPILILIILFILQSCQSKVSYSTYEKKMLTAAQKYFKKEGFTSIDGSIDELVTLDMLVDKGYIKSPEKALKNSSCDGSVTARRNGEVKDLGLSGDVSYGVYLKCDDYNTNTLISNLMNDLTTVDSGLYHDGSHYIYKGDNVKNYISFYGQDYRIVSIDSNGIVKLLKAEEEPVTRIWDNKYNSEIEKSYGKSIYKDSAILKGLLADYQNSKKISAEARYHIVSYDACIGKRDEKDISISYDLDCSEILENQVISLVNISDFARASLDPECDSITSRSCKNYNYLSNVLYNTWTLNSITNNTYQVYYLNSGMAYAQNASDHSTYHIVIYIDGNETIKSGNGTLNSPYVIG